jgi:hypothetical protein
MAGARPRRWARGIATGLLLAFAAIAAGPGAAPAAAQVETPAPGTPLRAAILDAVRARVISEVGGPVEFVVDDMRVIGEWAFVQLRPQRPGGAPIPFVYSRYQGAIDAGAFDPGVFALLRDTPAGWLVYEYSLGATDVPWIGWAGLYPVPAELWPFPPY